MEWFRREHPVLGRGLRRPATDVLLDAIARSNGTRASVLRQLFATDIRDTNSRKYPLQRLGNTIAAVKSAPRLTSDRAKATDA
jgi:hypothetical protein